MLQNLPRFLGLAVAAASPRRLFTASARRFRPVDMDKIDTTHRLERLRELMRQHKVDIYSTTTPCAPYHHG